MFFSFITNALYDLCISNEQYVERKLWPTKPKGTFYIYKDGRIGTVKLSGIDKKDIKFLIQGIDLSPGKDGDRYMSLRESMDRQGWHLISDTEVCRRAAIGYDYLKDKVVIVIKTCSLNELRTEVRRRGLMDRNGNTVAIALDSGGSFCYCKDGEMIYDTDRHLRSIIFWR
jgi:exopolysaccharide biosynthesis protein